MGSLLLITGLSWVGAGVLGVFALLCIPCGHPFSRFKDLKRSAELYIALEHAARTSDLLLAAIASR